MENERTEGAVDWELPTDWRKHYNVPDEGEEIQFRRCNHGLTGMSADEIVSGLRELNEPEPLDFDAEDEAATARALMLVSAIAAGGLFFVGFLCGAWFTA